MKTFKLVALDLIEQKEEEVVQNNIPLIDGLIINREDEDNTWLIEAYTEHSYLELFTALQEYDEILVQVKITKESNEPATFITSIAGVNEIGGNINVLFIGTIVDQQKNQIEERLVALIEEGYHGEELLRKFKEAT
ncbi:YwpF family protein [Lentibacillus sediminis]|uniref:YwpF family protein n=1 Tax=Lentibacillus sediminis TaxID=1940529 RepID=UPI000C1C487D|nr:YwpF family protein [Lentibacillus sediminis]